MLFNNVEYLLKTISYFSCSLKSLILLSPSPISSTELKSIILELNSLFNPFNNFIKIIATILLS